MEVHTCIICTPDYASCFAGRRNRSISPAGKTFSGQHRARSYISALQKSGSVHRTICRGISYIIDLDKLLSPGGVFLSVFDFLFVCWILHSRMYVYGGKMHSLCLALLFSCQLYAVCEASSPIKRQEVVRTFNVCRNASSSTTPLQVGNGNFAFGVDVTGLQTFNRFASMSTWGWHNFSLPTTPNQTSVYGEIG